MNNNPVLQKDFSKYTVKELKAFIRLFQREENFGKMKKNELVELAKLLIHQGQLKNEHTHLVGSGFFDFFRSIKTEFNNGSTKVLKEYGDMRIMKLQVIRTPIMAVLNTVLNAVSFGAWKKKLNQYKHDQLFHLGLIATLNTSQGLKDVILEKNEVINISTNVPIKKDSTIKVVPLKQKLTLKQLVDNSRNVVSKDLYFKYDPITNNCQNYILYLLNGSKLNTPQLQEFVKQSLDTLASELPSHVKPIMSAVTNLGARVNQMLGKGKVHTGDWDEWVSTRVARNRGVNKLASHLVNNAKYYDSD